MERDFMGLTLTNTPAKVREGATYDGHNNSVLARGTKMQWSFSNKVSARPQFLSFKAAREERPRKTGYDSLPSTGYITISTAEALNTNHKPYSGVLQKNLTPEKPMGTHYTVTTYLPQHFDALSIHHPQEVKILPAANQTNQTVSFAMATPVHQSFIASGGHNMVRSAANLPPGGVPAVAPIPVVTANSAVVGITELRNSFKTPRVPSQLTVFYDGSVSVYDDVTPEKAQAIMLLAGNGPSVTPNTAVHMPQPQAAMPRPSVSDGFVVNQSHSTTTHPGLSSPISGVSQSASQSAGISINTSEKMAVKPEGALTPPSNTSEPSKLHKSLGSVVPTPTRPAVPQARKASLSRFLEKRKERIMSASPYASNQSPDCSTPGSRSRSFSVNSLGFCPLVPAMNKSGVL